METVGEIMGDVPQKSAVERIDAPRHPGQPTFPQPGIYFGMPDEVYHSIHACSASGLKKLSVSSMDYWANSVLNLEKEEPKPLGELSGKELGRAYHTRICEGPTAFYERYYVKLDQATARFNAEAAGKKLCVTIADLRVAIDDAGGKPKGTSKDGLIEQLFDLDADAHIWDHMQAKHEEQNEGKIPISTKLHRRIEIAAAMIAGDPQLKDAFTGGHAEVSIFWYDERTGIPCKARLDYLKLNWLVDLKSFSNKAGKPVQRAIDMAISYEKYFIPVVFYLEAIAAAKKLIRDSGGKLDCVGVYDAAAWSKAGERRVATEEETRRVRQWCWQWAHQPEPDVLFVFQQSGVAPVTRGRIMPKAGAFISTDYAVQMLKKKWAKCAQTFGVLPWVDAEPVVATEDEALTFAATDFGTIHYAD